MISLIVTDQQKYKNVFFFLLTFEGKMTKLSITFN